MLGMNILKLLFLNVIEIPSLNGSIRIQQIRIECYKICFFGFFW